jgi:hypothetical protein
MARLRVICNTVELNRVKKAYYKTTLLDKPARIRAPDNIGLLPNRQIQPLPASVEQLTLARVDR